MDEHEFSPVASTSYARAVATAEERRLAGFSPRRTIEGSGMKWAGSKAPTWEDVVGMLALALRADDLRKRRRTLLASDKTPMLPSDREKIRKCLGCGGMFRSSGPGNRLCGQCR